MSVRRTVLAASVLALAFVFVAGASAKRPPPPPPGDTGPTAAANLRLTVNGPYSVTLGAGRVQDQREQLVVLHPARRAGLRQGRPAEDDVHVLEAVAGHDVQLLRDRDHLDREAVGP